MKLLIASDIHGDLESARIIVEKFEELGCDRMLLLGDLLYHGPRNNLPSTYDPKAVIDLLNRKRDVILAVRGNCDTEVDQMVLNFPILADYAYIAIDGLSIFATHGHKFNLESLPPLSRGDILLHGHTHLVGVTEFGENNLYINPGSIALPKGGNPRTFMVYENKVFTVFNHSGEVVSTYTLTE